MGFSFKDMQNMSDSSLKELELMGYYATPIDVKKMLDLSDKWMNQYYETKNWYEDSVEKYNKLVDKYNEINKYICNGLIFNYKIKCPNCGDEYKISLREYNYNIKINCYKCNHEYTQCDNIVQYTILDREEADKVLGYK